MAAVAGFDLAPMHAALPWFGAGLAGFGIDPVRAAVLAPLLLAAAATITAAGRPRPGLYGLIAASVLAVLAQGGFGAGFFGVMVLLLGWWARQGGAFALAALPEVVVMVARHADGLDPAFALAGGAALLAGGIGAALAGTMARLARASAVGFTGLAFLALGLGGAAASVRAVEANALIAPALGIVATVLLEATGTDALDWLGGVARGMPRFALLALGGLAFAACLPPGPGYAAFNAVWRVVIGVGAWPALPVLATWFALMGFAALRGFAAIALGRPRSLRAAAAEDAARPVLLALAVLLVGGALVSLAEPVLLSLALVLAVFGLAAGRFLLRAGPIDVAAYDDGFARPPSWLPFGDPATQITATGLSAGLALPDRVRPAWQHIRRVAGRLAVFFRP